MPELTTVPGADLFRESIGEAVDADQRALLRDLLDWAVALEADGLCELASGERQNATTLYPRLKKGGATIAYVWNLSGKARLYVNGKTIAGRAPKALDRVEAAADKRFRQANMRAPDITDVLLDVLTDAYREAAGRGA